jgi:hypothetical protein
VTKLLDVATDTLQEIGNYSKINQQVFPFKADDCQSSGGTVKIFNM